MDTVLKSSEKFMVTIGLKIHGAVVCNETNFNRSKLPSPQIFWATHGIQLKTKNGWVMAKCLFHDDTHASMGINVETGGFFCHACEAKGRDVLAAHQLITGCDFKTAAKTLGAWEER